MAEESPLERVWEHREEKVYPEIFGAEKRGTFVLSGELFTGVFAQDSYDPRWLHYGVIEHAPTATRPTWIYVTTGASNPWELDPEEYENSEYSGFGTELVLEVPEQADWAILILQRMLAFNILLAHGRFGDKPPLDYGDRIPLNAPITMAGDSMIRHLVIAQPEHYADHFRLESGQVDFLHFIGVTDDEIEFAKAQSTAELCKRLIDAGYAPVTLPERSALPGI